jgi:hypothetical protein
MASRQQLIAPGKSLPASQASADSFNANHWLYYFRENHKVRPTIKLPDGLVVDAALQQPLIRSLQRFQIGETGDGRHLRSFAVQLCDPTYALCVDMFVKEEQNHAQILAQVISAMNGTLLSWHWSDIAFVWLRRLLGLKTELFILLIAEVIGKCFYKCVADKVDNKLLEDVFSLIVLDEIAHLEFHTTFLSDQLRNTSWMFKMMVHYMWCLLFYTACFIFVLDHRSTLGALGVSNAEFIGKCSTLFQRSAVRALGLQPEQS